MSRVPIRWRLTCWYAVLMAGALLLFGVAFYFVARHEIYDTYNEQLHAQASLVMAAIHINGSHVDLEPSALAVFDNDDQFVRLYGLDGNIVAKSGATFEGAPLDETLIEDTIRGTSRLSWLSAKGGRFGIITAPVMNGSEPVGALQVGVSRQDADDLLRILAISLGVLTPLVLVFATLGGYLLAGRALEPVAKITAMAASIGADDLQARLDLKLPNDEIGRLGETFDRMLTRIDQAFERQRRFTADAAHELRTPLSLMRGQVELALSRPRSMLEYQDALHAIDSDLARMTGLVSTLLSLARADKGKLPLERSKVDIGALERTVLEQFSPQAEEIGVTLSDESCNAEVSADEDLLVQVLVNLLENSLAHTAAGDRIALGCKAGNDATRLWVDDSGSGIAEADIPHVFEPFFRVNSGRSREQYGVGLGLAICKAIAEAHAGEISIRSELGTGTRVEVVIPNA